MLDATNGGVAAILFDIGDTLGSEESLVRDNAGQTLRGAYWPGMAEAVRELKARGYRLGVVSNIRVSSAHTLLGQEGLLEVFDVLALSEALGVDKPDPRIFRHALDGLGIEPADYGRVLHVGNDLERDVAGANGLGLTSVWIRWNDRYRTWVEAPWEEPDYVVRSAEELMAVVTARPPLLPTISGRQERGSPMARRDLAPEGNGRESGGKAPKWGSRVPTPARVAAGGDADLELAARYAPVIYLDRNEPFPPLVAGYTVFRQDGYSASFPRCIGLAPITRTPAALAVEYAIWSDWDIQHLYELEHIWTYVGADGAVVWAEGSWHGDFMELKTRDGRPAVDATHPVAYSQAGKHAFTGNLDYLVAARGYTEAVCGPQAGAGGVLTSPLFAGTLRTSAVADDLARRYLQAKAFVPAHQPDREVRVTADMLVPWPILKRWIPARVIAWLGRVGDASAD